MTIKDRTTIYYKRYTHSCDLQQFKKEILRSWLKNAYIKPRYSLNFCINLIMFHCLSFYCIRTFIKFTARRETIENGRCRLGRVAQFLWSRFLLSSTSWKNLLRFHLLWVGRIYFYKPLLMLVERLLYNSSLCSSAVACGDWREYEQFLRSITRPASVNRYMVN